MLRRVDILGEHSGQGSALRTEIFSSESAMFTGYGIGA
jgi:hypothetical protein